MIHDEFFPSFFLPFFPPFFFLFFRQQTAWKKCPWRQRCGAVRAFALAFAFNHGAFTFQRRNSIISTKPYHITREITMWSHTLSDQRRHWGIRVPLALSFVIHEIRPIKSKSILGRYIWVYIECILFSITSILPAKLETSTTHNRKIVRPWCPLLHSDGNGMNNLESSTHLNRTSCVCVWTIIIFQSPAYSKY